MLNMLFEVNHTFVFLKTSFGKEGHNFFHTYSGAVVIRALEVMKQLKENPEQVLFTMRLFVVFKKFHNFANTD